MYFAAVALVGASLGQPPSVAPTSNAPVAQEYLFYKSRQITLPIQYSKDRKSIRQILLYVARNGENTWYEKGYVTPERDSFNYTAEEDGVYWFTIVEVDLQGNRNPADLTKTPPDVKVIVDTTKPRIQYTKYDRYGETIAIKWVVDDKYPNDNKTRVQFRKAEPGNSEWFDVRLNASLKSGVEFNTGTLEPIVVRVIAYDMAGNSNEAICQFGPGVNAAVPTNPSPPPPSTGGPVAPISPVVPPPVPATSPTVPLVTPGPVVPANSVANSGALPPPDLGPVAPVAPGAPTVSISVAASPPTNPPAPSPSTAQYSALPPLQPASNLTAQTTSTSVSGYGTPAGGIQAPATAPNLTIPVNPPVTPVVPTGPMYPVSPSVPVPTVPSNPSPTVSSGPGISMTVGGLPGNPSPPATQVSGTGVNNLAPVQPLPTFDPRPAVPFAPQVNGAGTGQTPLPAWTGTQAPPPAVELPRANVINFLTFDIGYEVESHGPSGISRVDLWVTRDDGRTWRKWSNHDGKGSSIRVNLNVPMNPQPEGPYGFRIVPISGAGLSEKEPVDGDAPELRVVVDITKPQLDLYPPVSDPTNPDTLLIQWKAIDKNFTDDPITIEWSDKQTGPWQPVAPGDDVVQSSSVSVPTLRRLPNTGQYAWRVPSGLPPRVYLKVCARDAAGNVQQVITREPILVDLVKPRAKISGIVPPAANSLPKP
jgi:hypothetical protein